MNFYETQLIKAVAHVERTLKRWGWWEAMADLFVYLGFFIRAVCHGHLTMGVDHA